jgi:hypothetical protein
MVGGLMLRGVCSFLSTRKPDLLLATGMVFFQTLLVYLIAYVVVHVLYLVVYSYPGSAFHWDRVKDGQVAMGFGLGVVCTMFAAAGLYKGAIPQVTYGKALAIYWLQVTLVLGLLFAAAVVAFPVVYLFQ